MGTYVRKASKGNFSVKTTSAAPDAANVNRYTTIIGQFFKKKRSKINLSLRDVEKELRISNSTLSRYETATIDMPVSAMIELCRFYGCRIGECVADADGLIMAENLDVLARKASKQKADRLLNKRKNRHKTKEIAETEQKNWDYVCDIAVAGVKVLNGIEQMDVPADYRVVIERDLSKGILDVIESRMNESTAQRLAAYAELFKKYLQKDDKNAKIIT